MPRPVSVPKLTLHKASGKAVVRLNGHDHYLGIFGTTEAKKAYDLLIAEWLANGRMPTQLVASEENQPPVAILIDDVLGHFWVHAERYYRTPDGQPTEEIKSLEKAIRPMKALYGQTPATEFGPKKLKVVREKLITDGLSRGVINRTIDRIRRVFKWATSEELIPPTVYQGLRTVVGLRAGRTEAPDAEPVEPVDPAHVEQTLPRLNRHVRAMVELQQLTGMRPGEVCRFKLAEVDRSGELWLYRPRKHKTAHHGKDRVIPLGPRSQAIITAFLVGDCPPPSGFDQIILTNPTGRLVAADAYREAGRERDEALLRDLARPIVMVADCVADPSVPLFSPRLAREERYRAQRASRKSKVPPSQKNRKVKKPKHQPGERYHTESYAHAVEWAAKQAGVPHWHPNQLRHTFATEVRKAHGLEAAQVLLGHSRADVTQIYAERNLALATKVAAAIG